MDVWDILQFAGLSNDFPKSEDVEVVSYSLLSIIQNEILFRCNFSTFSSGRNRATQHAAY